MKKLMLIIATGVALTITNDNAAASQLIYDTDGSAGRVTYYNNAPISAMVTQSSSTYDLSVYTPHYTNPMPCQSAAVYDQNTDTLIVTLSVTNKTLSGKIPRGHEDQVKYVQANCTDEQGNSQTLRHKLAPAPKISFTSQLTVADWIDSDGFRPGYYDSVVYQAQLNIDNGEPDGFCHTKSFRGIIPTLLTERHNTGFYSDVITVNGEAKYDAVVNVLVNEVTCKSTGGTTRAVEVWEITEQQQNREIHIYSL